MMAWIRLDDSFPDHPKAVQAGPMASWLYICGLAYANRYLTDGFIPERQAKRLTEIKKIDSCIASLVAAELWEKVEGGYQIHDYLDYQSSAQKVKADREKGRQRVESYRSKNSGKFENSNGHVTSLQERYNGVSNADVTTAPINIPSNNLSVGADAPANPIKALPRNGPAQSIVAAWYACAGGAPVSYPKAVGLGQKLADLGCTEDEVAELYDWMGEQEFFQGKWDMGTAVTQFEKFRQSKKPRRRTGAGSGIPA
jgi:hypothetical protein